MRVFDDFERTHNGIKPEAESTFSFLNRSAGPAFARIRAEIERWFANYPASGQAELAARFPKEFISPFFELLIHELFRRLGAAVELHPSVGSKGKRPDFRVRLPDVPSIIVEATLSQDENQEDSTRRKRLALLFDAINTQVTSRRFFIDVRDVKEGDRGKDPTRNVVSFLRRELASLEDSSGTGNKGLELPPFEEGGWQIRVVALPKSGKCVEPTELIGLYPMEFRWGTPKTSLLTGLKAKAKHYGKLEEPLLLVVNTIGRWGMTCEDQFQALFGTRQEYVPAFTNELRVKQRHDGLWGGPANRKGTRVSGVLFAHALPWNVPRIRFLLYRNPWATHSLPTATWPFEEAVWEDGRVLYTESSIRVGDVLELPEDWPGALFDENSLPNRGEDI
jgi:hypothetical protein